MPNSLYIALELDPDDRKQILKIARQLKISIKEFDYYNDNCILPYGDKLKSILLEFNLSKEELMLKMGIYNSQLKKAISYAYKDILKNDINPKLSLSKHKSVLKTEFGELYQGDCLSLLEKIPDESFDLIFADPPFNLAKIYPSGINDSLSHTEYIEWTEEWLEQCIRVLKKGGSLFLWNIPKWNTYFSDFLNHRLSFRHWISVDIKYSLPIQGKLYPSHYSLLYYVKGIRPNTFHPDRLPMKVCPKCSTDIKDYGGYKNKMNPAGVNISDVWDDIPPVRHAKYKRRKDANELSIKLLDRVIEMSSEPGDLIFDPFGGSGTTYIVSEIKHRRWVGIELGPITDITDRFKKIQSEARFLDNIRSGYNNLFTEKVKKKRKLLKLWTDETYLENGDS